MAAPASRSAAVGVRTAELRSYGQAIWLDFIRRDLITAGGLQRLIDEDGLSGVTSNPAIFERAIEQSDEYQDFITEKCRDHAVTPANVIEALMVRDVTDAADILRPVYDRTRTADGYVSLEVTPVLAGDTKRTMEEARRLWREVNRPNLLIKVPGTPEGVPATRQLLTEGINVNITLLFARDRYEAVACAYLDALEARLRAGEPIDRIASVASFFVSRIDTAVDALLTEKLKAAPEAEGPRLERLLGVAGIANAKLAYREFKSIFSGPRWDALASRGARVQRVLWASTSVKNPRYRDTMYAESLIGPDTINTMPLETLAAFREHGRVRPTLEEGIDEVAHALESLEHTGISLAQVTDTVLKEGVQKFVEPYLKLLKTVERRCAEVGRS